MSNPLGVYRFEDASLIYQRVLGGKFQPGPADDAKLLQREDEGYYVRLLGDLAAATGDLTGYTQTTARIRRYKQGVLSDSLDMEEADSDADIVTVTNRHTNYSASLGDIIFVERYGAEYRPPSGSGGAAAADGCGCSCLDNGDIVVDGVETTSQWVVGFGSDVIENQLHGSIHLPAGSYTLTKVSGQSYWRLDVGDDLVAYNLDGEDVTPTVTMDGTLTFYKSSGGKTKLELCITGTIPEDPATAAYAAGYADGYFSGWYVGCNNAGGTLGTSTSQVGTLQTGTGTGTGIITGTGTWNNSYSEGYQAGYDAGILIGYNDCLPTGTSSPCGTTTFEWISGAWSIVNNNCVGLGTPDFPDYDGSFEGQQATTNCIGC
jgi:hypothetical protein